jgi:hypothetical protein
LRRQFLKDRALTTAVGIKEIKAAAYLKRKNLTTADESGETKNGGVA